MGGSTLFHTATSKIVQFWGLLRRLLRKPTILFTFNRYISYALQFIRGIILAKVLGPFYFGVWGFLMLVSQYLSYTGLGLEYAINVELAVHDRDDNKQESQLIGVTLTATLCVGLLLLLVGFLIQRFQIALFAKYSFSQYALILALIVALTNLNQVYANIYRVFYKLGRIALYEFVLASLPLVVIVFYQGEQLIRALLMALALAHGFGVLLYTTKAPFSIRLQWETPLIRYLLIIGIPLLIYSLSFWLITLVGRTIISIYYSVEAMGYFSLANNLTNAVMLGLRAIVWVVFPIILTKTKYGVPDEEVWQTVRRVNTLYGTAVFLAIFSMIFLAPILFIILPQYQPTLRILIVLLMSQAVLSITFGYNSVAIARKQQIKVAGIAVVAVSFVLVLGFGVASLGLDMIWVATAMLIGAIIFTYLQARLGEKLMNQYISPAKDKKTIMPLGSAVAVGLVFIGCLSDYIMVFSVLGLISFLAGNVSNLKQLRQFVLRGVNMVD